MEVDDWMPIRIVGEKWPIKKPFSVTLYSCSLKMLLVVYSKEDRSHSDPGPVEL